MPPPARTTQPQPQHRENIQYESTPDLDIPPEEIRQEFVSPTFTEVEEDKVEDTTAQRAAGTVPSIFSSLLPKGALSSHFPFGHGIGSEELLILAVMLMVFLSGNESGEVDSEFILLLGLLLFAG